MIQNHSKIVIILIILFYTIFSNNINAQTENTKLPVKYEELTAPEFVQAITRAESTCIIPLGILEKHGPHLPLGTDLIDAREIVLRAANKEYSIVFPEYYFGQIYEAKHQPGTIAYSPQLVWNILQETCDELTRNGIKKIILFNGHGGNKNLLHYFCQVQLANRKNYTVILFSPQGDSAVTEKVNKLRKTEFDSHAGETETSMMLAHRPDLAHSEQGKNQSGEDLNRLAHLPYAYTGIWWYAKFPNHYAGDGSYANPEIGELLINSRVEQLVELIKAIKKDKRIHSLQQQFFKEAENPLKTRQ